MSLGYDETTCFGRMRRRGNFEEMDLRRVREWRLKVKKANLESGGGRRRITNL